MEIVHKELFEKYRGHPIRIKLMHPNKVGIAEGIPIVYFKDFKLFRIFFPYGNYLKKKNDKYIKEKS